MPIGRESRKVSADVRPVNNRRRRGAVSFHPYHLCSTGGPRPGHVDEPPGVGDAQVGSPAGLRHDVFHEGNGIPLECQPVRIEAYRSKFAIRGRICEVSRVTRVFDRLALDRGLPRVLRTDNGPEFCSRAMLTWAHQRDVALRLIEPGKPNQNAYVESFHSRFRDECLNEHWFTTLAHAQAVIEAWRREYNEERPKKRLGGLAPAHYAKHLAEQRSTITVGL